LNNLIANAVKYSPEGGPVEIAVRKVDGGAAVSVTTAASASRRRSSRRSSACSTARPTAGRATSAAMGLGLYISKEIVDRHGGELAVESAPGKGSTFTMKLPRKAIAHHAQPSHRSRPPPRASDTSAR